MREWSVYEQNQLIKYGLWGKDLSQCSEMPVEYITGHCEFDGLDFLVNKDVLIPRVESAEMLQVLEKLVWDKANVSFAEIGCGAGAIGIALYLRLKKQHKKVRGVLADISAPAVQVAKKNAKRLVNETTDLAILVSDLMNQIALHPPGEIGLHLTDDVSKFDVIFANLPYIPSGRVPRLPESVVDYEPHIALDGGPEGLTLLKRLLVEGRDRVAGDGAFVLEIDYSHDIPDFVDIHGYHYEIIRDEFGQNRFLAARPRQNVGS